MNRTLQGRLLNELRIAGISTVAAANQDRREVYLPQHKATVRRAPRDPAKAFVPLGPVDLDASLCQEEARVIAPDTPVTVAGHVRQIERQAGRRTGAGLRVLARHHLDGTISIIRPPALLLGRVTSQGQSIGRSPGARRSRKSRTEHEIPTFPQRVVFWLIQEKADRSRVKQQADTSLVNNMTFGSA